MRNAKATKPTLAKVKKWSISYMFLAPALALIAVFLIYPAVRTVHLSFYDWNGMSEPEFVGGQNYVEIFGEQRFWDALSHNIAFTLATVATTVVGGMLLAIAIDRKMRGWPAYKFIYYIPVMLSVTVVSVLFVKILDPNTGLLNELLRAIGLDSLAHAWLSDPRYAMASLIFVSTWQYCGFTMILFLAAMAAIPPSVHEAATLDGVSEWRRFFSITLPIIKRPTFVVIMLQIMFAFKTFDIFWVMTRGGPGTTTEVLATYLYRTAFNFTDYGKACAIAVVMLVLITTISLIYVKKSRLGEQVIE